jgi:hypothetical protein
MLKGFFYRRMPKNSQSPADILIRFEINSKESILATVANLNEEGIHFSLPRGKVILVPDERILLILNSPKHGEFKIPCDVYYFCNEPDPIDSQQVSYGAKFFELSDSTWEVIQEFCGNNLHKTPLFISAANDKPAEKQPHPPLSSAKPAADIERNPVAPTAIPAASFMPFTPLPPIMPVADVTAIPNPVAATNPLEDPKLPTEPKHTSKPTSKTKPAGSPLLSVPGVEPQQNPKVKPIFEVVAPLTAATANVAEQTPPTPDLNVTSTTQSAPNSTGREKSEPKPKTKSVSKPAAPIDELHPATKEEPPAKPHQSPIQALAASLATPPPAHTQSKAQSLSQEMIDRLIEKLQAEAPAQPAKSPEPVVPPDATQTPDHLQDSPSEFNPAYQSLLHSGQSGNQPQPGSSEDAAAMTATPFDPFTAFKFKAKKSQPVSAEISDTTKTVPLNSFTPFATAQDTPSDSKKIETKQSVSGPEPQFTATDGFRGKSLGDFVNNIDSTINKNATPGNTKPFMVAKPEENTGSHISRGEFKKSVTPMVKTLAHGSTIIPNTSGVSLDQKAIDKLVDSLIQDMAADDSLPVEPPQHSNPNLPSGNNSIVKNWAESALKRPVQPQTLTSPANSTAKSLNIIGLDPNNNRVMDQKSIDLIVKTLTEADSISSGQQPAETNPIPLRPFQTKEPKRTLDQKAIDQVVQALTQNYSAKNNPAAGNGTTVPFNYNKQTQPPRPNEVPGKERTGAFSLASLTASLQLENGKTMYASVEEIYVGGLIVVTEQELPLNSGIKLNLMSDYIHITGVSGICTNCEANPAGKTGFLAEIFFKNMTNTHMEQFRTLIAKLEPYHQG